MLSVNRISKSYSLKPILNEVTFTLTSGEKVGLIGPNGCGKSTLLKILTGEETPDSGTFQYSPGDLSRAYLPQGFTFTEDITIEKYVFGIFQMEIGLENRLIQLSQRLVKVPEEPETIEEYSRVLSMIEKRSTIESSIRKVLTGLGLDQIALDFPVSRLSGGQKTRLALAGTLLLQPDLLILDEPTNHLDIEMLGWLENWLKGFHGGVLVVSHDRVFLDQVCSAILAIDPATGRPGSMRATIPIIWKKKPGNRRSSGMRIRINWMRSISCARPRYICVGLLNLGRVGKRIAVINLPVDSSPIAGKPPWVGQPRSKTRSKRS